MSSDLFHQSELKRINAVKYFYTIIQTHDSFMLNEKAT